MTTALVSTDILAQQINQAHKDIEALLRSAFTRAIDAGELLIQAKNQFEHGRWSEWVNKKCNFSIRTAQVYMKIAREYPNLDDEKAQHVAHLPLREIVHAISEPKEPQSRLEQLYFHENIIKQGMRDAMAGYGALMKMRDEKLYVELGYKTFYQYCKEVHQLSKREVDDFIDIFRVITILQNEGLNNSIPIESSGLTSTRQKFVPTKEKVT